MKAMKHIFLSILLLSSVLTYAQTDAAYSRSGSTLGHARLDNSLAHSRGDNSLAQLRIDPSDAVLSDPVVNVSVSSQGIVSAPVISAPMATDPGYRYSNSMIERRINMKVVPVASPSSQGGAYASSPIPGKTPRINGRVSGTGGSFTSSLSEGNRINPGGHINFGGNGVGNGGSSSTNNGNGNGNNGNGLGNGGNRHPGELTPIGEGLFILLLFLSAYTFITIRRRKSLSRPRKTITLRRN